MRLVARGRGGRSAPAEIGALAADLQRAGTRVVVLTGGEPLVRPDVMAVADVFRARGMRSPSSTTLRSPRRARDGGLPRAGTAFGSSGCLRSMPDTVRVIRRYAHANKIRV